jgi:8-oxo-dGTP diphosphatase
MTKAELTNMCMIFDKTKNKVLVQRRKKSWKGITFPGGHVEEGEGLVESVIREIKEETGLVIWDLKPCGIANWYNHKSGERYFVFNFKTENFSGELIPETEEGRVFWADVDELSSLDLCEGFKERLPMFLEDKYIEGFTVWNEEQRHNPLKWY